MPAPEPDPASHLEREHEASTPSPAEPPRWQSQLVPPHPRLTHWCITHSPPSYHPPHCAAVSTTANGRSAPSCRRRYVGARAPSQCATPSAAAVAKASTPALIKAFQRATSCGARMCAPSGTGMGSADGGGPPRTPAVAMTPRATLTRKAGESSRPMLLWQRTMTERGTELCGTISRLVRMTKPTAACTTSRTSSTAPAQEWSDARWGAPPPPRPRAFGAYS
mmetsp:Transcript_11926/g.39205  ORF Transcript_11926/g.39205 Transcript_11926/m.39205 type:complete len:222 (-) Transcript_11926:444-1109(-)